MSKFFAGKWLTAYGMACGYIHKTERGNKTIIFARIAGTPVYEVEVWDRDASGAKDSFGNTLRAGLAFRETYLHVREARRAYKEKLGDKIEQRFEPAPDVQRSVYI